METMGRHVIAELWGCDFDKLNSMEHIEQVFVDAALMYSLLYILSIFPEKNKNNREINVIFSF